MKTEILIILLLFSFIVMGTWQSSHQKEIDVWIQDQTTPPFQYYLMREDKADIILTAIANEGDTIITVSSGHGFTAGGEYVVVQEGDNYTQTKVISVDGNDIEIMSPIANPFTTASTVIRGVIDMNINATSDNEFICWMRSGVPIDIQNVQISIWNASAAGDEGTFGDLAALDHGLRFYKEDGINIPLGSYATNSDFREFGAEVGYTDRAGGGGTYGVHINFDIKNNYGVVVRLDPNDSDKFKGIVQKGDDLSSLDRLRVSLMGQKTLGE
jgi:hypothetical protein